jgi:1,4-alpha-glucan branching enzyme
MDTVMPTRRHDMPYGAQVTPHGVDFRLWAPGGDGWFELSVSAASSGTRYRYDAKGMMILANDANEARHLGPSQYVAQWNDDIHHALHVLCSGETDGYFADYADQPLRHLGGCLAQGLLAPWSVLWTLEEGQP